MFLANDFKIGLRIICIKVLAINFYWQYNDSKDKEKVFKIYKDWQINESENEERPNLPIDYKNDGYIPLLFLKILNCPVNLDKGTKSLTYLVNIESKRYKIKY